MCIFSKLEDFYQTLSEISVISRSSTLNSDYSVVPPAALPVPFLLPPNTSINDIDNLSEANRSSEAVVSSRSSVGSVGSNHRDYGALESPALTTRSFSEPVPSSQTAAAHVSSTSSASTRRRPLPRPPSSTGASPTSSSRPSIQPQASSSSTAPQHQLQQSQHAVASTSNRYIFLCLLFSCYQIIYSFCSRSQIQRRPTQKNFPQPVVFAPSAVADPSNYEEESEPTDPSTEYADHYSAYLPKYYPDAKHDPYASASLGFAPMRRSRTSAETFHHGPDTGTFMSAKFSSLNYVSVLYNGFHTDYDILRRPSHPESLRLAYREEGRHEYDPDYSYTDTLSESYDLSYASPSNATTVTTPTPRSTTPHTSDRSQVYLNHDQHQNSGSGLTDFVSPISTTTDRSFSIHAPSTSTRNATVYSTSPSSAGANTLWNLTHPQASRRLTDDLDAKSEDQDFDLDSETDIIQLIASVPSYHPGPLGVHELDLGYYFGGRSVTGPSTSSHSYLYNYPHTTVTSELDERRFMNISLLSNIAVQLRDKVPRGTHVKGSIPYPRAFTGKDVVVCFYCHLFTRSI